MNSTNVNSQTPARRRGEMITVAVFIAISILVPLFVGELYPFTVSPMFRDQPKHYCTYELSDETGVQLDLETYGLHLVYDGNPPGLGMGIEAPATLHEFGEVPTLETVVDHLREVTAFQQDAPQEIHVCQNVVACDGVRPQVETRRIIFRRNALEGK